uniref:Uncharacterized protein n=1 Tax=Populus trichocarpa TaxID=3694 RepID=A9P924_POPTR|nr:unknown [Populus trichocarpa]
MVVKNSLQFNKTKSFSTCDLKALEFSLFRNPSPYCGHTSSYYCYFFHIGYRIIVSFPRALNCCWLSWVGY